MTDVLGSKGRARLVAETLLTIQQQRWKLEVAAVANDLQEGDTLPGTEGTIGARVAALDAAEARVLAAYSELLPEVEALLEAD